MFRRHTPTRSAEPIAPRAPVLGAVADVDQGLVDELAAAAWVLPRGLRTRTARWTLTGTVGSPTATAVDPAGLVVGDGWALDWWVGADDRWHLPAQEAAVRQQLVDDMPVVETRLRIPGGDAVHRAFGVRSPRSVGDEWVVVEVENATPVPFAVALVVRPFVADAVGSVQRITAEPTSGGRGRDVAHLVRVDGTPAMVVPRRPAHLATGCRVDGDVAGTVTSGAAGTELVDAHCPDGLATLAMVFPVPHTAVLRVTLPVGEVDRAAVRCGVARDGAGGSGSRGAAGSVGYPAVLPDVASVASGWDVHRRGTRLEVPDVRLSDAVARSRTHLLLAHDGHAVRRDGHRSPDLEPGATEAILGALDALDRPADVGEVVADWPERLLRREPDPAVDALVLQVVARHWLLHRDNVVLGQILPDVAAAVERIDRADRRSHGVTEPIARRRTVRALRSTATLMQASGQASAATAVSRLAERMEGAAPGSAATTVKATSNPAAGPPAVPTAAALELFAWRAEAGDPTVVSDLTAVLASLPTTSAFPGPGPDGRAIGHDLAAAAALVLAARALLVAECDDGLALLPVFSDGWYGAGVELHDAPTGWGRLSYAVRWHGSRPALLWELAPHPGVGAVRLTIPGLDATWCSTEPKGDALLAEVTPPEGADLIREVAEHPDIDPAMRRPGREPAAPSSPLPEGGTFS